MRVFLDNKSRDLYFKQLKEKSKLPWHTIANQLSVNDRHLRDYKTGKYSIPSSICARIERIYNITLPKTAVIKKDFWNNHSSARAGGLKRIKLYGELGTPEGRKKGGLNSIRSQKLKNTNFKFLKHVYKPKKTKELSELIGIMIGDGGITKLQARVTLNLFDDIIYSVHVASLFEKLFKIDAPIHQYLSRTAVEIIVSSKELVSYLNHLGLPIGNKIKQEIDIPQWIKDNPSFRRACVRGIFDTDGCIYSDKHKIKGRNYHSTNIAIVSASPKLLSSISKILIQDGLNPSTSSYRSIRIRKTRQVVDFFDKIGSNNPKHLARYKKFIS